jgi:hypothetical protein
MFICGPILNKPRYAEKGAKKKFVVNVVDPDSGKIKKVRFGQKGVRIKKNDPAKRKSFRARHKCNQANDITSASYWSCEMW